MAFATSGRKVSQQLAPATSRREHHQVTLAASIAFVEAEAGSFADRSTVPKLDSNVLLLAVILVYCNFRGLSDVKANLLRHVVALFDFLRCGEQLDCCDHFFIS